MASPHKPGGERHSEKGLDQSDTSLFIVSSPSQSLLPASKSTLFMSSSGKKFDSDVDSFRSPLKSPSRPSLVFSNSGKRFDPEADPIWSPLRSPARSSLLLTSSGKRFDPEVDPLRSPLRSPSRPSLVLSNSGQRFDTEVDPLRSPLKSPSRPSLVLSNSGKRFDPDDPCRSPLWSPSPSPHAISKPGLAMSNSGKRFDQGAGKKKYVKQVTGRHNDTDLHLAAKCGDLASVRQILNEIDEQMVGAAVSADFDAEVAEIRSSVVNEVNELGETALFVAAEAGHCEVVEELLKYSNKENISRKNQSGFDALHKAASQGHQAIVQVLLEHDPSLSKTLGPANATPLISAASRGHTGVVRELLSKDSSLLELAKTNGKNALHLAARQGHADIVNALLNQDPQLARRTDKKGQTALHMAVKGVSCQVVRLLLAADAAIVMLPDKFGNTALHVATRKKRAEIVNELLLLPDTNVNALNRNHKTALDITEGLPLSEDSTEIKECLGRYGAVRANELNQPRDELRKTVTQIRRDVHTQLEQAKKTNKNVNGIAKELKKLHREGINNATNSVTVVAVLFSTVAFAALFTVPGGADDNGVAVMASRTSFKIFFIFNAISLFTSLAVVVVQITLVRGETKSERRVIEVINKLMWLASVTTTVCFIAASYIVVGRRHKWAAILVTVIGTVMMGGVLGTMTYYVVKYKRSRKIRKRKKSRTSISNSWHRFSDFSDDSEINTIYAI